MNIKYIASTLGAMLLCAGCEQDTPQIASQNSGAEIGASLTDKQAVPLSAVPEGVLAAARMARPDLAIQRAERESRNGVRYYDLEGDTADGAEIELDIMADGDGWAVVEIQRDLAMDDVPMAVREVLGDTAGNISPSRIIESVQADGVIIYEFFTRDANDTEAKYEVKWANDEAVYLSEEWVH